MGIDWLRDIHCIPREMPSIFVTSFSIHLTRQKRIEVAVEYEGNHLYDGSLPLSSLSIAECVLVSISPDPNCPHRDE